MSEQHQSGMSDRVLTLGAEAVTTAVHRTLGFDVSELQARELARIGSVEKVISLLRERMTIRRSLPGVNLDKDAQIRLAISEIVADRRGVFDQGSSSRSKYIQELMSKEHKNAEALEKLRGQNACLLELDRRLEKMGYAQRTFTRKVARLRAEQIARLHSVLVADENRYTEAVRKLDLLYEQYLTRALESSET